MSVDHCYLFYVNLISISPWPGVRVSGDLRYLFAVGRLDDLELLKKEVAESRVVIEGLHAVTKDRIHQLNTKSPDKVSVVQSLTYSFKGSFDLSRDLAPIHSLRNSLIQSSTQ